MVDLHQIFCVYVQQAAWETVLLHVHSFGKWVALQENAVGSRFALLKLQDLSPSHRLDWLLASDLSYFLKRLNAVVFVGTWRHFGEVLVAVEWMASEDLLGKQVVVLLLPLLDGPDASLTVVIA